MFYEVDTYVDFLIKTAEHVNYFHVYLLVKQLDIKCDLKKNKILCLE